MNNINKLLILLVFICIVFLCPLKAEAGTASNAVDKGINLTAKATYYVTKYTLKAGWFVIKKTAKGVFVLSKNIFKGSKDAFSSPAKAKPVKPADSVIPVNKNQDNVYTLPPVPKIQ